MTMKPQTSSLASNSNYITTDIRPGVYYIANCWMSCEELETCEHLKPGEKEEMKVNWDISKFCTLNLVIEPSKFVINPEKGTKFRIKYSLDSYIQQDVIISCHSFLYEIKNARRKIGMTSQWFHVMKKDETKEFEIVMRDLKDESMENFANSPLHWAAGCIEITQYESVRCGETTTSKYADSDAEWGIEGSTKLIRTGTPSRFPKYWKLPLESEFENEQVKQRTKRFCELRAPLAIKEEMAAIEAKFTKNPMTTTKEYWSDEAGRDEKQIDEEKAHAKKMEEERIQMNEEQKKQYEELKKEKKMWGLKKLFKRKKKNKKN